MTLRRRRVFISGALAVVAAAIGLGWWLGSPLFISTVVDEAFPFEPVSPESVAGMSEAETAQLQAEFRAAMPSEQTLDALSTEDRETVADRVMTAAAGMPDHVMAEPPPAAGPVAVLVGQFVDVDDRHRGMGSAMIFRSPDGRDVLRFEDFRVTNGPALSVLLSTAPAPLDHDGLGEFIDLGPLKGNVGNQNYEIPSGTDVSKFQSVVIYCVPFRFVFSTATLAA